MDMTTNAVYSIFAVLLAVILYFSLVVKTKHKIINGIMVLIPLLMFFFSIVFLSGSITGFTVYDSMKSTDIFHFNLLGLIVLLFTVLLVSARELKAKRRAEMNSIRSEISRKA